MATVGKAAIVLEGGALRSAHGGGFLHALHTELGIAPDMVIGSSADGGNAIYYSAGQTEQLKRIWTVHLSTWRFIALWRFWRVINVDYLVDVVLKKYEPLDLARAKGDPIAWFASVTDFDSGSYRYISARDGLDPFEVMRASAAMPVLFRGKIRLNGRRYIDGDVGVTLEDHVRFAIAQGADRLVLLRHNPYWSRTSRFLTELWARSLSPGLRRALEHDMSEDAVRLKFPGIKIILLMPRDLPVRNPIDNRKAHLLATWDRGYADALALKDELRELFSPPST